MALMLEVQANPETNSHINSEIEILELDVISYENFIQNDPQALITLNTALSEKGIVGIKGIPEYLEKAKAFIQSAQEFNHLPEDIKLKCSPNRDLGECFLGYEVGKENFKRPDGKWVTDELKVSYYALVPNSPLNKWPLDMDLKTPYQELGDVMSKATEAVLQKINVLNDGLSVNGVPKVGRMLYYQKNNDTNTDNPFWCGSHCDHGLFTALLPASYFLDGQQIEEPIEAGLFVKTTKDGTFKKVIANDPDVLLFQVGEFSQLISNDKIKATEHRVHKAQGPIERYTMALFVDLPMDAVIYSTSELTNDERYGNGPGCSYKQWHEASLARYLVKDEN